MEEFSGYHFQYVPTLQRTVRIKLLFKVMWVSRKSCFYLLELLRLAKCCFSKNLINGPTFEKNNVKPMQWMIQNIKLHCTFYSILFPVNTASKNWKSKKKKNLCLLFVFPRHFSALVKSKWCTNKKLKSTNYGIFF